MADYRNDPSTKTYAEGFSETDVLSHIRARYIDGTERNYDPLIERLADLYATLQSRLSEMEANEAVYRKALDEIRRGVATSDSPAFAASLAVVIAQEALANPSPGAARLLKIEKAARQVLAEPTGCVFCDSGKLRNPNKPHEADCGFSNLQAIFANDGAGISREWLRSKIDSDPDLETEAGTTTLESAG